MARIEQDEQPRSTTGSGGYSETPAQKAGWQKLREWIEDEVAEGLLSVDDTFTVKGYVASIELDGGKYFSKTIKDRKSGEEKKTTYTKTTAVITDPRFAEAGTLLPLPRKDLGTSFFDGTNRDGTRGTARGGMWHLHRAVHFAEPPQELIDNKGSWDTDDYTGPQHPVLLVVTFAGFEPEGSQYANSRAGLRVFLSSFDRDVETRRKQKAQPVAPKAVTGDEFDDDPEPTPTHGVTASNRTPDTGDAPTPRSRAARSAGAGASGGGAAASTATAPGEQQATERQVKFIIAIAREAGLEEQELADWSQELFGKEVQELNRRDASSLIEALQRRRNEVA